MIRMQDNRIGWGLAGLLGFEGILAAYTFANGATAYVLMALAAGALLVWALWRLAQGEAPSAPVLWLLAAVMAVRAAWQTSATMPPGLAVTWLVPVGFALLAVAAVRAPSPRLALAGIALVALARAWFVLWYFGLGNATLALANLVAAVGAVAWAAAEARPRADADELQVRTA